MTTYDFYNELIGLQSELFRFAMMLTSNREDAEDLTQDTLLRALIFQKQFNESTNLQA